MSRASRARRIATAAAYGGGGVGVAVAALYYLLRHEERIARERVTHRLPVQDPPTGNGIWGRAEGAVLTFAVLGDSSAVGLGVEDVTETPGVMIASALSELAERPVRLIRHAVTGAHSEGLLDQVDRALVAAPEVALIMIGTNDVTARIRSDVSVRHLAEAVRRLRDAGCEVVVGTCPDLGTIRPVQQPLRYLGRRWSRELAAAQTIAVIEAGGRTVSLGSILGPEFASRPELFSPDQFHPSAAGYAAATAVLLPSIADAIGAWPVSGVSARVRWGGVRPIANAAARAAAVPGTEVSATTVAGHGVGPRGRWARSRRRTPADLPPLEQGELTCVTEDGRPGGLLDSSPYA